MAAAHSHNALSRAGFAVLLLAVALPIEAGPWPREKGKGFLSFALQAEPGTEEDSVQALADGFAYGEFGMTDRLTAGFSGEWVDTGLRSAGRVWLRMPVGDPDAPLRFALIGGMGLSAEGPETAPILHLGATAGRGWSRGKENGWATLDLLADIGRESRLLKMDATLGWNARERLKVMGQLLSGIRRSAGSEETDWINANLGLVWSAGDNLSVEVGAQLPISGEDQPQIKLGTWLEF